MEYEQQLSNTNGIRDVLYVEPKAVRICSWAEDRKVGEVKVFTRSHPTEAQVEAIKAVYVQGQASIKRQLAMITDGLADLARPIVVSGPGNGESA